MGKWSMAEANGCCFNCDNQVGYENLVVSDGWPVCEDCAIEREMEDED